MFTHHTLQKTTETMNQDNPQTPPRPARATDSVPATPERHARPRQHSRVSTMTAEEVTARQYTFLMNINGLPRGR